MSTVQEHPHFVAFVQNKQAPPCRFCAKQRTKQKTEKKLKKVLQSAFACDRMSTTARGQPLDK